MVSGLNNFFVKADNVCDYIPVISTLSNLTDLFQKCVVLPFMNNQSIKNSHYYTHLKSKSVLFCIVLLIPVIGNVINGVCKFAYREYSEKDSMIDAVRRDGRVLGSASEQFKGDRYLVFFAVEQNGLALEYASDELKGDWGVVFAAVEQNGLALRFASKELKVDKDVVITAVQQNGLALRFASEKLKGDKDIMLAAVKQNGLALEYASEELKGNRDVVLAAVEQNGLAFKFASEELQQELR